MAFQVSHTDSGGPRTGRKHFMQSNLRKLSPPLIIFAVSNFFQVIPNKNFRLSSIAWQISTAFTVQQSKLDLRFWRSGHFSTAKTNTKTLMTTHQESVFYNRSAHLWQHEENKPSSNIVRTWLQHDAYVVLYRWFSQKGAPAAVNHVFPSLWQDK